MFHYIYHSATYMATSATRVRKNDNTAPIKVPARRQHVTLSTNGRIRAEMPWFIKAEMMKFSAASTAGKIPRQQQASMSQYSQHVGKGYYASPR